MNTPSGTHQPLIRSAAPPTESRRWHGDAVVVAAYRSPQRGTAHWAAVPGVGGDTHPLVPRVLPSRPGGWVSHPYLVGAGSTDHLRNEVGGDLR